MRKRQALQERVELEAQLEQILERDEKSVIIYPVLAQRYALYTALTSVFVMLEAQLPLKDEGTRQGVGAGTASPGVQTGPERPRNCCARSEAKAIDASR